jgi:DNA-binding GntR family transcriptional regulator
MSRPGRTDQEVDRSLLLAREPLGMKATEALRAMIRDGRLAPGTRLIETDLANLLGVSRGPVREALRNLEREGFVAIAPDKGAVVNEWDNADLLALYDVRNPLEVQAIRLATQRDAPACVADLHALLDRWEAAGRAQQHEAFADLDFAFHRVIWRHAGNRFLINALEQCIQPIQTVFYLNTVHYDDLDDVLALHHRIVAAIASGDDAAVRAAMEAHMENSLAKARQHSEQIARS